jgi:hypothetical protein
MSRNSTRRPGASASRIRSLRCAAFLLLLLAPLLADAQTIVTEAQRILWPWPSPLPVDSHFGDRVEINFQGYGAIAAPDAGAFQPMITVDGVWTPYSPQTGVVQTRAMASDSSSPLFTEAVPLGTSIRTIGDIVLADLAGGPIQALAIRGSLLAVGQPGYGSGGRVQIYSGSVASGFALVAEFLGLPNAELGSSLAIDDGVVVAGAPGEGENGAVKTYVDAGGWITLQSLDCPATSQSDARFGESVALAGDILAVGAPDLDRTIMPGARIDIGGVYVYDVPFLTFELQSLLRPANGSHYDHVGTSVDLTPTLQGGLVLAVGAPGEDLAAPDAGAAAVYDYDSATETWRHILTLVDSEAADGDALGSAVSATARGVLAGAPNADGNGVLDQGAALYFDHLEGWIFADGFELGHLGAWSSSPP